VADFGSYLRFVNRSDQCDALVQHLQSRYDSLFLPRVHATAELRGRSDDYLKHLQVVYSAGAPGIGKTTWARMALDHISERVSRSESFQPVLHRCVREGWRYRISYGADGPPPSYKELLVPELSIAARWLWEHLKYRLPAVSSMRSFSTFWDYISSRRLTFTCKDVLEYVCAGTEAADRMVLINLDEVNALFTDSPPPPLFTTFLTTSLLHLLQLQLDGDGFVFPVLTATKALETKAVIKHSGCSFLEIPLPLLGRIHVHELIADLHARAQATINSTPAVSSVEAATAALSDMRFEVGESSLQSSIPPLLSSLLELMAGHPRFLELLLFVLGRPNSKEGLDEWRPAQFVANLAALSTPSGETLSLQPWLMQLKLAVQRRYAAFHSYLNEPRFFALVPQLLGYTLFDWKVTRQAIFREGDYECSVQTLEENGVVFLTPKEWTVPQVNSSSQSAEASAVSSPSTLSADPPSLRLVIPFLWLLLLSERYESHNSSAIPCLPLVSSTQCTLSPAQNEQLTVSVLALKCMCFSKLGRTHVSAQELLGVHIAGVEEFRLPEPGHTLWPVLKLRQAVTEANWPTWLTVEAEGAPPRHRFFNNAEKASSWDGCALTKPPICVQDKQALVSRERVARGQSAKNVNWTAVEKEIIKCQLGGIGMSSVLLYCTDSVVIGRPSVLPERVALIDQSNHALFFGPILAQRRAMCLSEVPTSLIERAPSGSTTAPPVASHSTSQQ
jgi:hypothetical protein